MPDVPTADEIIAIADPRERLLAAGARLLVDDGFRVIAAGLSPERVAALARRSRRTFYEHFETKEDFLRALLASHIANSDQVLAPDRLAEDVLTMLVTDPSGSMLDTVDHLVRRMFVDNMTSDAGCIHTIAWAAAGSDPATHASHQAHMDAVDALWERNVSLTLDTWGLALRPPWTPVLFGQVLIALSDGYYLRTRIEDGADHSDDYSLALSTLMASAMQRLDEPPEQLEDRLASLRRAAAIGVSERQDPVAAVTARRRLLDALEEALHEQTLPQLTLGDVADRAGVGIATVRATFPDLTAVLTDLVADRLPPLDREIDFDRRTTTMDTAALLRRHLARLHAWSAANPGIARAISSAVTESAGAGQPLLLSVIEPAAALLRHARAEREFEVRVPIEPLATVLTFGALGATLIPGSPTDVDWLVDLVVHGLMCPRDDVSAQPHRDTIGRGAP
jgi:AcrR family transcriptional regulator